MEINLPDDYYLSNFIEFIDHVYQCYDDLLNTEETDFYNQFHKLSTDAQKLYVRMLMRKGETFRKSKLSYKEISNKDSAADELVQSQFILLDPLLAIEQVLPLYNRQEWQNILSLAAPHIQINKSIKRSDLDTLILSHFNNTNDIVLPDKLLKIEKPEIFEIFKLMFFGNMHQDLSEFVLRDLGLYQYEEYAIDHGSRLFQSREQIQQHLNYYQKTEALDELAMDSPVDIESFFQNLPEKIHSDRHLCRRLDRLYFQLARQLERLKDFDRALKIYKQTPTPDARQRIARVLIEQQEIDEGLAYCRQLIASPLNEEELVFAQEFSYRQAKKHKIAWPAPAKYQVQSENISLPYHDNVEIAAAEYFAQQGQCYYLENALFCSVFGLHYWNLIFAPVRGAFTHPFQSRPHDLYEHDFILNREKYHRQCDNQLESEEGFRQHILAMWQEKHNNANSFIYWQNIDESILKQALNTIPLLHWQAILKRMCSDLHANRNGFPDLILFPHSGHYELIEIKGPGDRLQKNQMRWMQYFQMHKIPHRVVNVEWDSLP